MKFNTALRFEAKKRLEQMERADIIVGIPCFNNELSIGHVIETAGKGLADFFPNSRSLVLVSDGGSTDDTREAAISASVPPGIEKIVTIYRGIGGKGSAFRAIFEATDDLECRACVVCDSDLRSIRPDWVFNLANPVLESGYAYVTPVYSRYKYDGTITNNLVYCLTRALFGTRLRQPIGGDFGFSRDVARYYLDQKVWESDVAGFGVDIWMTISAVIQGFHICQARLGAKVHDPKDPAASLGPMFRQVIYTLFEMIDKNEGFWRAVHQSKATEIFGSPAEEDPEALSVDVEAMIEQFRSGYRNFAPLWQNVTQPDSYKEIQECYSRSSSEFAMKPETWIKIVYDFVAAFHKQKGYRRELMSILSPLYFARVASFVVQTRSWSHGEAEAEVERQAALFEKLRPYLEERWVSPRVLPDEQLLRSNR